MGGATEAGRKGDDGSEAAAVSSFQVDFSMFRSARGKRDFEQLSAINGEAEADRGGAGSDDEENGLARKKLRLTKDQSAFLEESFKEHNTLNPVSLFFLIFYAILILILKKNLCAEAEACAGEAIESPSSAS